VTFWDAPVFALCEVGARVTDGGAGGVEDPPVLTEFMTTVESTPLLCDVTAKPARTVEPRLTVAVEPGMSVHVLPSGDV
jgi:hypothetical protein